MPRQDVPYQQSAICRLRERIAELFDLVGEKMKSINGVRGDGQGNVTLKSGDPAIVINNDQAQHEIEIGFDSTLAVTSVNGQVGAVDLDAADIKSEVLAADNTVEDDLNGLNAKFTDGSVTKVGTANVGSDTKPTKLVGGVPTAVTNDLVDVSSAQTITEQKNFRRDDLNIVLSNPNFVKGTIPSANKWCTILFRDPNNVDMGYIGQVINTGTGDGEIRMRLYDYDKSHNSTVSIHADHDGSKYMTVPYRTYNSANINDAVTIGSLASNPNVVHTTGNETIDNNKTFTGQIIANNSIRIVPNSDIRRGIVTRKANSSDELYFMGNYLDNGPFEITYVPTAKILFQAYSDRLYSGTNPTNEQSAIRNIKIVSGTPTGGQDGDIAISINNGIYARSSGTWSKVL